MADFSDVAVNADMVKIANAIRRITRTSAKMTISEMPGRLTDIRVLEYAEIEISFAKAGNQLLGQYITQYPHLFMVLPKANEDAEALAMVDPEITLVYDKEGNLYLTTSLAENIAAKLIVIDFLLPSDEETRGMLIYSSGEGKIEGYDARKPYKRGQGFLYNDSYGITIVDHEPESFNAAHCIILANQVFDSKGNLYHDLSYYSAMLAKEIADRQEAANQLQQAINTEADTRAKVDSALQGSIDDEADRATAAEKGLQESKLDKSGNKTFDGNLTVTGDLVVRGVQHIAESETLLVEEKVIEVARKNTQPFTSMAGIMANNYDGKNSGGIFFDNEGTAFVGDLDNSKLYQEVEFTEQKPYVANTYYYKDVDKYILDASPTQVLGRVYYEKDYTSITKNNHPELVPLAARERVENWTEGHMPIWDASKKAFKDSGLKAGKEEIEVPGNLEIKTKGSIKELKITGFSSLTRDGKKLLDKDLDDFTEAEYQAIVAEGEVA